MNILLAADGSPYTKRAARHLAAHVGDYAKAPKVHVLHVHAPVPYGRAAGVVGRATVEKYQAEESEKALAAAVKVLSAAGVKLTSAWMVGDVAQEVAAYVKRHDIDLIVMGSHGHGQLLQLALGSTATKVIAAVKVPVLIVP